MKWGPWSPRAIRRFIRELDPVLRLADYHVGLTGSALCGGGTGKDLDVIVYPRSTWVPRQQREPTVLAALASFGLELYVDVDKMHAYWASYGSTDRKCVRVYAYGGRRVDVMFLE